MERRALYHSLRVNWQLDPMSGVEPWQVEEYRKVPADELFARLAGIGVPVEYAQFMALADSEESPEDLAETLLPDDIQDQETADQIYLIVFELWRRLLSERQTLSIFCDEWDHQIDLYEAGHLDSMEGLGDVLNQFSSILEETKDEGEDPKALYESILQGCAHDVEAFLYDFSLAQIQEQNIPYAEEIVENFIPYVKDKHWFKLLNLQILAKTDPSEASRLTPALVKDCQALQDLEFNLEFLAFLATQGQEDKPFTQLAKLIVPQLSIEEDFWDFLSSAEDYFHYKDAEDKEEWVKALRARRFKNDPDLLFSAQDPDLQELLKLFK